ncbi:hypothetical protein CKO11_06470 [Rhodobacter sp. TJ_12]|uniref:hypothetical protein n=1 Tax=Rhodobacter sp. TJ_12 TaxID=2029399 RepID=UPI001CC15AA4|nr:hypothetical protein [Rhodobacter sp. TJ_12]MBZ4022101.1 hypothetical protein [Rhodobacter sp. TJ_12]
MSIHSTKIIAAASLVSVTVLAPVTVAFSSIDPDEISRSNAQARMTALPEGMGRPMDDLGPDIAYGDLSVFDAIEETGAAQSPDVPYCDRQPAVAATLSHDFGEHPRVKSPLPGERAVTLWASDLMGTWTAVYTRADGVACVVSSGIDWKSSTNPVALLESEGFLQAG